MYCINVIVPCSPSIKLFFLSMENQKGLFLQDLLHFFFVLFFNVKSKKVTFAGSDYVIVLRSPSIKLGFSMEKSKALFAESIIFVLCLSIKLVFFFFN